MDRIFLVVKGNRSDAEYMARRRGISLEIDAESDTSTSVYCYAPMIDWPKIVDWYYRRLDKIPQRGDCLWYTKEGPTK